MKSKKNQYLILLLLIFLIVSIFYTFSLAQTTILHIACVHPKTHILNRTCTTFGELLADKTNGKLKVMVHCAGELGNERDYVEMMQAGTLDASLINTVVYDAFSEALTPLSFPFLLPDKETAMAFVEEVIAPNRFKKLEDETGVVPLSIYSCGWRYIYAKEPVSSIEDLKGRKKRVMETPYHIEAMKALEINPVPLPWGEVYTALQLGTVDLAGNEIATYVQTKFYEVAPYFVNTKHTHTFELLGFSKKIMDTFDPETQKKIKEAAQEATSYWWGQLEEYEEESFEALRNLEGFGKTIHLIELSDEERANMREIVLPVLLDKFSDKLGEDVLQWLEENDLK